MPSAASPIRGLGRPEQTTVPVLVRLEEVSGKRLIAARHVERTSTRKEVRTMTVWLWEAGVWVAKKVTEVVVYLAS
jgi:hypothetical protein